jgi:TolB-like protein/phage shock protein PspC (stress-responsive transcriptional regulator)
MTPGAMLQQLRERKLARWLIGYAAGAWVLLQVLGLLASTYGWPPATMRIAVALAVVGFFLALVLAWYHGERGLQRVAGTELLALALVLAVGGGLAWKFSGGVHEASSPAPSAPSVAPPAPAADKSIAVLPFASLGGGEDNALFADGLSEEIINSLARVPDLQVAARSSSFALRNSQLGAIELAATLKVSHVREGSIRRAGKRLRISVQLIRAKDGFNVWTESYDRSDQDIIAIQEDVARSIAQALKTVTDPKALAEMQKVGTRSVAAYDAYLKGLALVGKAAETGKYELLAEAVPAFDLATSIDPEFMQARLEALGLAASALDITAFNPESVLAVPYATRMRDYKRRLAEASGHVGDNSMAVYLQAQRALVDLRLADALRLTQAYLAANPRSRDALVQAVLLARTLGETTLAREYIERLFRITGDPGAASGAMSEMVRLQDYARAVAMARDALRRFPGHANIAYQAQRAFLSAGRVDEAAALVPELLASDIDAPTKILVQIRQACGEGRRKDAEALFRRIDHVAPDPLPRWHGLLLLGRTADAERMVAGYDQPEQLYAIWPYMTYPKFDVARYPNLRASLQRQGIAIRPAVPEPYNCPPAGSAR